MFWTTGCRATASVVAFFIGWTAFQIVRPVETVESIAAPAAEILAIKFESLGCSDTAVECPVYEMTLRNDGTVSYVGHANDNLMGKHEGGLARDDFDYLVKQINSQRFFDLPQYISAESVEETIVMEVVTSEGSHRVTTYSWDSLPSELRALHALMEYQTYYVHWYEEAK